MKRFTLIAILTTALTFAGITARQAVAQHHGHDSYGHYLQQAYAPQYGYGYGYGYQGSAYHHASTYEEGVLRGFADVIRSRGSFNLNTSIANINNQQARSLAIDNNKKAVETFFEVRRINREARAQASLPRPSAEDLVRFAGDGARDLVSPDAVETAGDKLVWPAALSGELFAAERAAIDELMARRSESAGIDAAIRDLAEQLEAKLKAEITNLPTTQYLAARKFVTALKHVERLPLAGDARLASR